ncbi:MAG: AsmA family protein [Bacteroidetes bacterium]|nr:AsmA family protein [Bacteroidota bacterium]
MFITFSVLVVITTLLVVTAFVLEAKIKAGLIAEINARVTVPVKVEGGISLSLFKHFPYGSVTFSRVTIDDKFDRKNKKLVRVEEISLLCNIYSLFSDKIEFSKIVLRNGELNLYKDESGKMNFDILKPTKNDSKQKLTLQIKKAQIKEVKFVYSDKSQGTVVDLKVNEVVMSGNFDEEDFELTAKSQISVNRIEANGEKFLSNRNISAETILNVDKAKNKYSFKNGKISIDESDFSINGFFALLKNETQLNFNLKNEGNDMQQLFSLFPEKYKASFTEATGSGEYAIAVSVKGILSKSIFPSIKVSADLKNSEIKLSRYNKLLQKVNAKASYELDTKGNDRIIISNFDCTLNNEPFNFKLSLENLSNPVFNFSANGVLHLNELSTFIPDSVIQDIDGTITFSNFHLQGKKDDFNDVENSTLLGSGEFKMEGVEFRQNDITYGNINGLLKYENRIIEAHDFTLNFMSTDFNFSGNIENLFAFAYNLAVKRKANDVVLGINGKVKMQTFNLSAMLDAFGKKNRPQAAMREKINPREIFNMKGNLEVEVGKFIFREMQFDEVKTNLQVARGIVQINHLRANAMAGELKTTGQIAFTTDNTLSMKIDLVAVDLNIPEIFSECENFGQGTLTDKHLKGKVSTSISLNADWRNYKDLDMKTLSAVIDFRITNGELNKFEPLRAASKFVRVEELENIRFADLENTIKIANGRIDVPEFEIKTSALNLMFFGFHNFDNTVDYHLKINLHKLLAQKFRRNTGNEQFIEEDPYEGVNLYLTLTGPINNLNIKFDKAGIRKKIQTDFRNERQVLKDLLNNSRKKIDENEQKREEKYFDVKEEPQFMDFDTILK